MTDIIWRIHVVKSDVKGAPDSPCVALEWGWTAGLTEEDLKNYAEDAPRGKDSVIIGVCDIPLLICDLFKHLDYGHKQEVISYLQGMLE